jgi:hypothetical protein
MIDVGQVRDGDVILSSGDQALHEVIRFVDAGDYTHASICNGSNVYEATLAGVEFKPIQRTLGAQCLVDVYRFNANGNTLGAPLWPPQPIFKQACSYVGAGYAERELFLLGAVICISRIPRPKWQRLALEMLGGPAAEILRNIVSQGGTGKPPMTCSQLVASAFYEATSSPTHKYGLWVGVGGRPSLWKALPDFLRLREALRGLFGLGDVQLGSGGVAVPSAQDCGGGAGEASIQLMAGSMGLPARMVSPRHLQNGSTLQFFGCLKDERKPLTALMRLDLLVEALERNARSRLGHLLTAVASDSPP